MSWPGYVTRRGGTVRLGGILSNDLGAILAAVDGRTAIFSDLTLGAWRPHQIASEFAEQLEVKLPAVMGGRGIASGCGQRPLSSASIDHWIDVEAIGNIGCIYALDAVNSIMQRLLSERIPRSFILLLPRFGHSLGLVNSQFVEFLTQALHMTGCSSLVLAASRDYAVRLPAHWDVEWRSPSDRIAWPSSQVGSRWLNVPGVLPGDAHNGVIEPHVEAMTVSSGFLVVPPASRKSPRSSEHPRPPLSRYEGAPTWGLAFQHTLHIAGKKVPVLSDLEELAEYAWVCVEDGDAELGLRLGQLGEDIAAHPVSSAHMLMTLQALRLRTHRYREIVEDDRSPRGLSPEMFDKWLRIKAYAAALAGNSEIARQCLDRWCAFRGCEIEKWNDLYARNLAALVFARERDTERALSLQSSIAVALKKSPEDESHLRYLNAINTARLCRQRKDLAGATEHYARAFAITEGVRTENDLLYTSLCWAALSDICDQPQMAFRHWFRAALHWAAARVPEALGHRCAAIVLQRPVGVDELVVDEFSRRLQANVVRTAATVMKSDPFGQWLESSGHAQPPTFVYTGTPGISTELRPLSAVMGIGWCVFLRSERLPPSYTSVDHEALRSILWALIRHEAKLPNGMVPGAVQIDTRFNCDIPVNCEQMLDTAIRLRARRILGRGMDTELTEVEWVAHEAQSWVHLGPGVLRIDHIERGAVVVFRRQWEPVHIGVAEARALDLALVEGHVLGDLNTVDLRVLRRLEEQRVITIGTSRVGRPMQMEVPSSLEKPQ